MNKVAYSPNEKRLLEILRECNKPETSATLSDLYYNGQTRPWHAQSSFNSIMRSLMKKTLHNDENFIITKTERNGPHHIKFQFVKKGSRPEKVKQKETL